MSIRQAVEGGLLVGALAAPIAVYAQVTYDFDLPAQTLADSLSGLGSQAHINVIFDPAAVKGREAPALKGNYEPKLALAKLLKGTDFTAQFTDSRTVVIKRPPPSPKPAQDRPPMQEARSAQNAEAQPEVSRLPTMTVTGSLLPRSEIDTANPLFVITAEDIKRHGFSSVADALQNLSINTGAISNTSINRSDIWSVKTLSLFGLNPDYTKFLIDGRPMPVFSQNAVGLTTNALYTNLSGIPINLVERIDVLPGGQSSLYGSDAIAGVVNIVMKKNAEFGTIDARSGFYSDGGGRERMLSASKSFRIGELSLNIGGQVNDQQPIWALQRRITAQNFAGGIEPQQGTPNIAATGLFSGISVFPAQPSDCSNLAHLWGGSERYFTDPYGTGFCGSVSDSAYHTMINKQQGANLSVHADYAVNDNLNLYADLLDNYQMQARETDAFYSSTFYDPNVDDIVTVQRNFAPEERGGSLNDLLTEKNYENTFTGTLGGKVEFGAGWTLDVGFTRSMESNDQRRIQLLRSSSWGQALLGPQLGTDDFGDPIYAPNYSLLADPITPAQYAANTGAGSISSTDRTDQLRAQLTQTSLFTLPGGDAGLAVVAEKGFESWKYQPGPAFYSGELDGDSFNASDGHRTRYATAAELNLPVFKMLTADLSARYDKYDSAGAQFTHPTYSVGLEFRPFDTLLLRGRYATSFKAPSLIDQFEGLSTYRTQETDYVNCARLGFAGEQIYDCPLQYQYAPANHVDTSNPDLKPLTAKSFSYGAVWQAAQTLSLSVDYQHIDIRNEVLLESDDVLLRDELHCADGTLDPSSPTCTAVNAQIVRAPPTPGSPLLGRILSVNTTKANIAQQVDDSLTARLDSSIGLGDYGRLGFNLAYTLVLDHRRQLFPGDSLIDLLNNPGWSSEFHHKVNAGLTWSKNKWDMALYGTYSGPTPNYLAQIDGSYDYPGDGKVAGEWIYNGSVSYSPTPAWRLSLQVNNILNSEPPIDISSPGSTNQPFGAGNYNPFGREISFEARYQFGHGGDQ
ncbi:MAG: TonB-dependent receptor [Dokdonella sp.]